MDFVKQIEVEIRDFERATGSCGTEMMYGFIIGSISALSMAGAIDFEAKRMLNKKINDAYHKRYQEESK